MELGLNGKKALITGGSKGMGRAIAEGLAREGARVTISARSQEGLRDAATDILDKTGSAVLTMSADVSDAAAISELVASATRTMEGLDILVINSGGPPAGQFQHLDDPAWVSALDLLLMSAVRLVREARPHLLIHGGSVVIIESLSVKQPIPGLTLSNAIRPAVIGLMKSLMPELAADGIRINAILPGHIRTDRAVELASARAESEAKSVDDVLVEIAQQIPIGRYGTANEIANLALFLASEAASYITGASILCDGGLFRGLM